MPQARGTVTGPHGEHKVRFYGLSWVRKEDSILDIKWPLIAQKKPICTRCVSVFSFGCTRNALKRRSLFLYSFSSQERAFCVQTPAPVSYHPGCKIMI